MSQSVDNSRKSFDELYNSSFHDENQIKNNIFPMSQSVDNSEKSFDELSNSSFHDEIERISHKIFSRVRDKTNPNHINQFKTNILVYEQLTNLVFGIVELWENITPSLQYNPVVLENLRLCFMYCVCPTKRRIIQDTNYIDYLDLLANTILKLYIDPTRRGQFYSEMERYKRYDSLSINCIIELCSVLSCNLQLDLTNNIINVFRFIFKQQMFNPMTEGLP
jgi:hypothetical protein